MMVIQEHRHSKNLNAKVKRKYTINFNEIEVQKESFWKNITTPKSIYNSIQKKLDFNKKANAVLQVTLNDGNSFWIENQFIPNQHNSTNYASVNFNIIDENGIKKVKRLYRILNKIEKKTNINQATKYLRGYLEENNITFNQLATIK